MLKQEAGANKILDLVLVNYRDPRDWAVGEGILPNVESELRHESAKGNEITAG